MQALEERYYKSVREDVHDIKRHMKSIDESLKQIAIALSPVDAHASSCTNSEEWEDKGL